MLKKKKSKINYNKKLVTTSFFILKKLKSSKKIKNYIDKCLYNIYNMDIESYLCHRNISIYLIT